MPQYKLTYFNLTALGEPIRWAFKIAEVEFEDERIQLQDWPTLKKSGRFPTESVPLLEVDGEVFTQSAAILKFVAGRFGLSSDDDIVRMRLDQILGITEDARQNFRGWFMETDPDKKEAVRQVLVNETTPMYLRELEKIVSKTTGDFTAGTKLTYGDLSLANFICMWLTLGLLEEKRLTTDYPSLAKLKDAVLNVPQIQAWIAVRPQGPF